MEPRNQGYRLSSLSVGLADGDLKIEVMLAASIRRSLVRCMLVTSSQSVTSSIMYVCIFSDVDSVLGPRNISTRHTR